MAEKEARFAEVIDYDKIDRIIGFYFESQINKGAYRQLDRNMFFLYCGGSASNVSSLVHPDSKCNIIPEWSMKLDSETIARLDIINGLKENATLTKHAEKLTKEDVTHYNTIFQKLYDKEMETCKSLDAPFTTTRTYRFPLQDTNRQSRIYEIPQGYVFSDKKGKYQFTGDGHRETFRAALKYITRKFYEKAQERGVFGALVIDDHMETGSKDVRAADTAITLVETAKEFGAYTQGAISFVKQEVGLSRGRRRFVDSGKDRSSYIDAVMQVRTYAHIVDLADALLPICDDFTVSNKNTDNHDHQLIAFKSLDGELSILKGQEHWYRSFRRTAELPKDPYQALSSLGWGNASDSPTSYASLAKSRARGAKPEDLLNQNGAQVYVMR